jgi:hypothetical protein
MASLKKYTTFSRSWIFRQALRNDMPAQQTFVHQVFAA